MKKITANIATRPKRYNELRQMLKSIDGQFDEIRIYLNETNDVPEWLMPYTVVTGDNLTDNGKFFFCQFAKDEIYCTLDDDIIYPPNYAISMRAAINSFCKIVTHHGRTLLGMGLSYYRGHKVYHFANNQDELKVIDVAGTGVTAFDTSYFNPTKIYKSKYKCMSDLIFSLEAAKNVKNITILPHKAGYLKAILTNESIFNTYINNELEQIKIADKIFSLKKA